ncbi:hypothetical protein [Microbacterium sp. SLBN-146]|uniref:hypothetical protein n=1 Tax=Microbacterium sp. SLBN-146 TaxID=2768457 RepID=UPI00114FAD01|nr:hypothetical protein [Microbacterium sp. SLBN-146]TQJ30147.1 hypothetical protein FBY39_0592 [Microbacterium sp. SLBN-146]
MTSLRDELGGNRAAPTPYTILCPPGWRRVPPSAILDDAMTERAAASFESAGRADLVTGLRALMSRFRGAVRESKVFEVYLPPAAEGVMLPATMLVSPFVLPSGVAWETALSRLGRGAAVESAEFTEVPLWRWERAEQMSDDDARLVGRSIHYLVPVPEDDTRRALHFHLTVMTADDPAATELIDPLVTIGDLMMSTFRWLAPTPAA